MISMCKYTIDSEIAVIWIIKLSMNKTAKVYDKIHVIKASTSHAAHLMKTFVQIKPGT